MTVRRYVPAMYLCAAAALVATTVDARAQPQFDAEYYVLEQEFGEQWTADDEAVQERLAALEQKFGKKPNIIKILVDDVGYSELGSYGGGKLRGAPTPNLDQLADQGTRFLQYYSEISCTPSRIALNTGRYSVRSGVNIVLFPGTRGLGLHEDEVTMAELLSDAGYNTAMFGKWHVGFEKEYAPTEHGFDEAQWTEGNPAPWVMGASGDQKTGHVNIRALIWGPNNTDKYYDEGGVMRGEKGQEPELVVPFSVEAYDTYDSDVTDLAVDYIKRKANDDKPFFLYVGGKANHFFGAHPDFLDTPAQTNGAAQMVEHDYNVGRIIKALKDEGIEENTLVVWTSDNGPHYDWHPHGGYSMFDNGQKGETFEGGVRVPAIAWWPGMIEAGQEPLDIVSITDWYTTFASIAGVDDNIPSDRVVDGVDQTALLMLGEDHGRRDSIFLYNKGQLESVRKDWIKVRFGGRIFIPHYNLMHDPAERFPQEGKYGAYSYGITRMVQEHNKLIEKFPHRVQQQFQREPDVSFNPTRSLTYEAGKQVDW